MGGRTSGSWRRGYSGNSNPKHDKQWKEGQSGNPDGKALNHAKLINAAKVLAHRLPEDLPRELQVIANESLSTIYEMMVRPRKYSGTRLSAALALREELCKPRIKQVDLNLPGQHAALAYAAISEVNGNGANEEVTVELSQGAMEMTGEPQSLPPAVPPRPPVTGRMKDLSPAIADKLRARLDCDPAPKPEVPIRAAPPVRRRHRKKVP